MHLKEGQIRAYQDGEIPLSQEAHQHLETCPECQERLAAAQRRTAGIAKHFKSLAPAPEEAPLAPQAARARLERRLSEKELTMWQKLFNRKYRFAWAALAVIAVLALALTFPQVRAIANGFLGLFRVEQITAVQVGINLEDMPEEMERNFTALDRLLSDQITIEQEGEFEEVQDAAAASARAGFPLRLPAALDEPPHLFFQPAAQISFEIERDRWQKLLDELGYGDFAIPQSADGAEVTINIPNTINAMYGACASQWDAQAKRVPLNLDCTILMQAPSPTIESPPVFDLNSMGQIFLQALGLSAEEAAEFSAKVDWTTTLVVPVPQGAEYQEVGVDGVSGILLEDPHSGGQSRYTLMWVREGMFYALTGDGTPSTAVRIANSLK
jgi:hypothetical protein